MCLNMFRHPSTFSFSCPSFFLLLTNWLNEIRARYSINTSQGEKWHLWHFYTALLRLAIPFFALLLRTLHSFLVLKWCDVNTQFIYIKLLEVSLILLQFENSEEFHQSGQIIMCVCVWIIIFCLNNDSVRRAPSDIGWASFKDKIIRKSWKCPMSSLWQRLDQCRLWKWKKMDKESDSCQT